MAIKQTKLTAINPYPTPTSLARTPAQKANPALSWARDDLHFFGAGACHILAYAFKNLYPAAAYKIIYTKPLGRHPGNHVYVRLGEWAFDAAGWHEEREILDCMRQDYSRLYPDWAIELVTLTDVALADFCHQNNHRLPGQYAHLPWERAFAYIAQFTDSPPNRG